VRLRVGRGILPWLFLTPLLVMILIAWVGPLILTVYLGFTDLSYRNFLAFIENFFTSKVHYTISNFQEILGLKDPKIAEVIRTTVIYVSGTLAINAFFSLLLSIAIAYFLRNEIASMILRVTWLLPRVTPGVIYALMWVWFVDPRYGMMNTLLSAVGVPKSWLPQSWLLYTPYSRILMIMINGYVGASFGMIIYTAAIKSIPPDLINAALVDGASEFQVARRIIVPLLKWPMLFVTAWQTLSLLASYEYILMVWGGGRATSDAYGVASESGVLVWSLYSYGKAFAEKLYGYASALSMILVVIGLALILLYFKVFGFRRMMEPSKVEV